MLVVRIVVLVLLGVSIWVLVVSLLVVIIVRPMTGCVDSSSGEVVLCDPGDLVRVLKLRHELLSLAVGGSV